MARQTTHQTEPNKPKNVKRDPIASGERDATFNRAAGHNYFLEDKMETGIVLTGSEVGELWLLNAHIGAYENAGYAGHTPLRTRKLLVHADELRKLQAKTQQKGYTLVPTRMYFKNGKIKCEIALAKGKQSWDKRETERRRTADKEAREAIARSRKQ